MKTINVFGSTYKSRMENAIRNLHAGKGIILVDDENRENEGDIIFPASTITVKDMALMIRECSGIVCLCLTPEKCRSLGLRQMVEENNSRHHTAFTISIEAKEGITTGVSAADRIRTIQTAIAPEARPEDLAHPGHVFPLMSRPGGVFERKGHTEGSIDLVRLAGLGESAILCELTNPDGTMARMPEILDFAEKYGMSAVSVEDIYIYRMLHDNNIRKGATANLPTAYGYFRTVAFKQLSNGKEQLALIKGEWSADESVLVRIHSSCATGDIFGSSRCDCGEQLHKSMQMIEKEGKGVIIYLDQEGRGIGLCNKIHAYKLQDEGMDTIEANLALGFKADEREYVTGAFILNELEIKKLRLITNNPDKSSALENFGFYVTENIPLEITPDKYNKFYLRTKKEKMGHLLQKV
ncbi:MAG: GTP cyclohydrolase II [Candidatus Azobacteroides sp.]|nr:GTP cyclohydrolase II [Candidatus Azobacteroides sp.]